VQTAILAMRHVARFLFYKKIRPWKIMCKMIAHTRTSFKFGRTKETHKGA
jgi:hypothetical protein